MTRWQQGFLLGLVSFACFAFAAWLIAPFDPPWEHWLIAALLYLGARFASGLP